ncbi:unnamed protein product [Scytosiphon promiscuus]
MSEERSRRPQAEGEGGGAGRTKKAKKSQKVMGLSGQTTEQRRELRLKQRALKSRIIEQESDIGDLNKDAFREVTEANAVLSEEAKYPREFAQAVDNLKLISKAQADGSDKLHGTSVGVNVENALDQIGKVFSRTKGEAGDGSRLFEWAKWGGNISMLFLALPDRADFMMGPLDKPAKERKRAQRRQKINDDDAEEVVPEMDQRGKKAKLNKDQTQTRITKMKDIECEPEHARTKKDMFETLMNPNSFTQTVENLFDFSFFVKSSQGHISIDEKTDLPQVMFDQEEAGRSGNEGAGVQRQWLMSFTPEDFRELKALYALEGSNIEHRSEGPQSDYYDPLVHGNRESNRQ